MFFRHCHLCIVHLFICCCIEDMPKAKKTKSVYCKSCETEHPRPVGRSCTRHEATTNESDVSHVTMKSQGDNPTDPIQAILGKLDDLHKQQQLITQRMDRMEDSGAAITTSSPIKHHEPEIMPSMEFLRSHKAIQSEVAQRIRQLDSHNTYQGKHSNFKSGRFRTANTNVNNYVVWPQELVYVGPARKTIQYDDLNSQQFTLGFIRAAQTAKATY